MKTYFDNEPEAVQGYGEGTAMVCYNVQEVDAPVEKGQKARKQYEADCVVVASPVTYEVLVAAMVADRYTMADELALLRQRDTKAEAFAEYNEYVEGCKTQAKDILGID